MNAAQKRWRAAQKAAVTNFKPITITYTIDTCPDCYGGRPQGNESAWAKGCKECNLYDACGEATEAVHEAAMTNKEWNDRAQRMQNYMSPAAWLEHYGRGGGKS